VLRCAMIKRRHPRKPRYQASLFKGSGGRAWMVYDERVGRLVVLPLHEQEARTLAHTLNVADLSIPVVDYGDGS
jgi:hypothetical protein